VGSADKICVGCGLGCGQLYEVTEMSVFGSAARGDLRPDGDLDLLADFFARGT
jgi:predicted nucleotidyltransferase